MISSVSIAAAAIERLALAGDRDDRVIAGHIGKAAEVRDVVEFGFAGFELLVATCGDREGVGYSDGIAHRLPQFDADAEAGDAVAFDFHGAAFIGAAGEGELTTRKPAVG